MARKNGWSGQVRIAFIVREDGGVADVKVLESSGFALLDRNALDTVRQVAPFPCPPVKAEIRMAITYRLN
jgi:protein TonB